MLDVVKMQICIPSVGPGWHASKDHEGDSHRYTTIGAERQGILLRMGTDAPDYQSGLGAVPLVKGSRRAGRVGASRMAGERFREVAARGSSMMARMRCDAMLGPWRRAGEMTETAGLRRW